MANPLGLPLLPRSGSSSERLWVVLETAQLSMFEKEAGNMQADLRLVCLRIGKRQTVPSVGTVCLFIWLWNCCRRIRMEGISTVGFAAYSSPGQRYRPSIGPWWRTLPRRFSDPSFQITKMQLIRSFSCFSKLTRPLHQIPKRSGWASLGPKSRLKGFVDHRLRPRQVPSRSFISYGQAGKNTLASWQSSVLFSTL